MVPDAHQALLADADLLLLPYDAVTYGPRRSGILAEARALGVPAVVPVGCWMDSAAGPVQDVIFQGEADFHPTVSRVLKGRAFYSCGTKRSRATLAAPAFA